MYLSNSDECLSSVPFYSIYCHDYGRFLHVTSHIGVDYGRNRSEMGYRLLVYMGIIFIKASGLQWWEST